jgi:nucleoside-diphosphate-sugar epimerase
MYLPTTQSKPYVLVTGATGMVGSQLMARLLARQIPVAVLARDAAGANGHVAVSAKDRVEHLLGKFESRWDRRLKRPVVLIGDINSAGLGLCEDSLEFVEANCSSVIHSAASLSFRPAAESAVNEPYRSNVGGTSNVAKVCSNLGVHDFHYISTAYVCGLRAGTVLESDSYCGQQFANDYEQSKLQAERLLKEQFNWHQLTIYRPSIVIDSTGLAPVSQDRTVYSAFSMFYSLATKFGLPKLGTWSGNLGLSGKERKNLVEAGWIAEVIADVFEAPELHGQTYHLTARTGMPTCEMERAFYEVTAESFRDQGMPVPDCAIEAHEREQPAEPGGSQSASKSLTGSAVLDAIAAPFVEAYLPHFRDDPTFDRTNIDAALKRLGLAEQAENDATALAAMIRASDRIDPTLNRPASSRSASNKSLEAHETAAKAYKLHSDSQGESMAERIRQVARPLAASGKSGGWGLLVCGSQGGDYWIGSDEQPQIGLGGERFDRRMYLSSEDLDALIFDDVTIDKLIASGRLVVEWDSATPEIGHEELQSSLHKLMTRIKAGLCSIPTTSNKLAVLGKEH